MVVVAEASLSQRPTLLGLQRPDYRLSSSHNYKLVVIDGSFFQ